MKKQDFILVSLIFFSFIIAIYCYPIMPDSMPLHWGSDGIADSYGSKLVGLFLFPIISIFIFLMFYFIPRIAVYKKNFSEFEKEYNIFKVTIILFLFILYLSTLSFSLGFKFNMNHIVLPLVAIMMYIIGMILPKIKMNYFIGIRTPWTLSNKKVWKKTHVLGGKMFKLFSLLFLMALLNYRYIINIVVVILLLGVVYLFFYSYQQFKNIE